MGMSKTFEVSWTDEVAAPPEAVWDAVTVHSDGWLWPITYEPRVGGTEEGLSPDGGTVTVWEPGRHFTTAAPMAGGTNQLDYTFTTTADGTGTAIAYVHQGVVDDDEDLAVQVEACEAHTDLYRHSMGQYAVHFAGRDATYVAVDAPDGTTTDGLLADLGLADAQVGDEVTVAAPGAEPVAAVVDYRQGTMVGWRSADGLHRIYGRDRWGWPVGIAHHLFAPAVTDTDERETA
jgi:uncharacterized protein YndB with AHSA1/START domain